MMTVVQTTITNSKDTSESMSSNFLLDTLSDVPIEALVLLSAIVLSIVIVSIVTVWMSCRLCASRRARRSTPATSVYKWSTLTSERTHCPKGNFGLRLFKPIAIRILEMQSKRKPETEHCNDEKLQQVEKQTAKFINISS